MRIRSENYRKAAIRHLHMYDSIEQLEMARRDYSQGYEALEAEVVQSMIDDCHRFEAGRYADTPVAT